MKIPVLDEDEETFIAGIKRAAANRIPVTDLNDGIKNSADLDELLSANVKIFEENNLNWDPLYQALEKY